MIKTKRKEQEMKGYREEIKEYISEKGITQSFICNKTGIHKLCEFINDIK